MDLLERLCTSDVAHQEDDTGHYSLLCNERGGVVADVYLVRLDDNWLITCDPGVREKLLAHLDDHAGDFDVKIADQTRKTAMLQVAGPAGASLLDAVLPETVSSLQAGRAKTGNLLLAKYVALRTNYLGAWSLEVVLPRMLAGRGVGIHHQEGRRKRRRARRPGSPGHPSHRGGPLPIRARTQRDDRPDHGRSGRRRGLRPRLPRGRRSAADCRPRACPSACGAGRRRGGIWPTAEAGNADLSARRQGGRRGDQRNALTRRQAGIAMAYIERDLADVDREVRLGIPDGRSARIAGLPFVS